MPADSRRDDVSRALKSIDRAWKSVNGALRAGQMTKAVAAVQKTLSVRADAEIYKDTGEIVALNEDDLDNLDNLKCGDGEEVVLTVDADTFVRVMDAAADRLENQARLRNKEADEFETRIGQRFDWIMELQEEHGFGLELQEETSFFDETALEGDRYRDRLSDDEAIAAQQQDLNEAYDAHKRLEFLEDEVAELQEQEAWLRQAASSALDEAARKRAVAQAQRRLVAIREVESEARRKADAAVAEARKRVTAALLADHDDSFPNDRTAELLERFADLVGSEAVQRLSADPEV